LQTDVTRLVGVLPSGMKTTQDRLVGFGIGCPATRERGTRLENSVPLQRGCHHLLISLAPYMVSAIHPPKRHGKQMEGEKHHCCWVTREDIQLIYKTVITSSGSACPPSVAHWQTRKGIDHIIPYRRPYGSSLRLHDWRPRLRRPCQARPCHCVRTIVVVP